MSVGRSAAALRGITGLVVECRVSGRGSASPFSSSYNCVSGVIICVTEAEVEYPMSWKRSAAGLSPSLCKDVSFASKSSILRREGSLSLQVSAPEVLKLKFPVDGPELGDMVLDAIK